MRFNVSWDIENAVARCTAAKWVASISADRQLCPVYRTKLCSLHLWRLVIVTPDLFHKSPVVMKSQQLLHSILFRPGACFLRLPMLLTVLNDLLEKSATFFCVMSILSMTMTFFAWSSLTFLIHSAAQWPLSISDDVLYRNFEGNDHSEELEI